MTAFLVLVAPAGAHARPKAGHAPVATLVVNTTADHDDGTCDVTDCTLREAMVHVTDDSAIQLPAGTYTLTRGELKSDRSDITLTGAGARSTIIDGADKFRLLNVRQGELAVQSVTFTRGNGDPGTTFAAPAGAFARTPDIPAGSGGAIAVQAGAEFELAQSAITASNAGGPGGGMATQGQTSVYTSVIAHNNSGAGGGGISASSDPGQTGTPYLDVETSTISDNAAGGNGGGIYGGIDLSLSSVTIAGNRAGAGGGGGLYHPANPPLYVNNTLLAGNTPTACAGLGAPANSEYDLVDDSSCRETFAAPSDRHGLDPQLDPLANNGGPTDTRALRPASPAIDTGEPQYCSDTDQRGITRPQHGHCDVGAYEASNTPLGPVGHIAGNPVDVFANGLGTLQLRFNADPKGAFTPATGEPADAGLAFMQGETYYPAGGPQDYSGPVGLRTAVSAPLLTSNGAGKRTLHSVYYVGKDLLVTEDVTYSDGARTVALHYAIKNIATTAVAFRAAELGSLSALGSSQRGSGTLGARSLNGGLVGLVQTAGSAWRNAQMGLHSDDSDVYAAFTSPGGLEGTSAPGFGNNQIGADWNVSLDAGDTRTLEVAWQLGEPTESVTVNSEEDPLPDTCDPAPGDCTLREALATPPDTAITLPKGHYTLVHGQLPVAGDHVVRGAGARDTVITAAPDSRVLQTTAALGLSGVTLTSGVAHGTVPQGVGGGILTAGGALTLADSAMTNNVASLGGAIYAVGKVSIIRSTISGNAARNEAGQSGGGSAAGILVSNAPLWVVNSTISVNTAENIAGGVAVLGTSRYENSTITGNTAPLASGVYQAPSGGGNPDDPPEFDQTTALASGTIVAGNHGGTQCAALSGSVIATYSLASDASCGLVGEGNRENVDAKLAPLGNNGGPTDTHALLAGSPAIDAMTRGDCPTGDQRGTVRPAGGACDIGATEGAAAPAPPPAPVITAPAPGAALTTVTPTLAGTAAPGATIDVKEGTTGVGTGTVDGNGAWSVTLAALGEGAHTVAVTATNAGGTSDPASRSFIIDVTPPPKPAITTSGEQPSSFALTGQAEPGSQVTVYEGDTPLGTTVADAGGAWTFPLAGVTPGEHAYSAVARDAAGHASPRSAPQTVRVAQISPVTPTPTPTATPTATPPPEAPLPPPVVAKDVNVEPKTGTVLVKVPGTNKFVVLEEGQQIPVGTTIDTTKGRVTLTSAADANGKTQTADFYDGIFKVTQTKGPKPVTVLTLVEKLTCPKGGASAAAAKKKSRRLWGDGKGSFRTSGKYSAATIRGTTWLTQDDCTSTLTRVTKGVVEVRDNVLKKTVLVKAGKRYTARARRR